MPRRPYYKSVYSRKSRADEVCLTFLGRELVERELYWLGEETWRYKAGWLTRFHPKEEIDQEAVSAVIHAAVYYDPKANGGRTPFGAFARTHVRWKLKRMAMKAAQRLGVWRQFNELGVSDDTFGGSSGCYEGKADMDTVCHRGDGRDRLLSEWCSADYADQRRCIDWRARVVLCLSFVECLSHAEIGEVFGISRSRVQQIVYRAVNRMARWRALHRRVA